jgi:hypothetical protein
VLITDLLEVTISVSRCDIERLLSALAELPFAINPTLRYEECTTHVDFPAYRQWLDAVHGALSGNPFLSTRLRYTPVVDRFDLPRRSGDSCTMTPLLR